MLETGETFLKGFWYLAAPASDLGPKAMLALTIMGEPLVICRKSDGSLFALRDICPHRGIPLRYGQFDGTEVTCSYHGWRFGGDGRCTAIPSLLADQASNTGRIRTQDFPAREVQGNIWVFFPLKGKENESPPDPPQVPDMGTRPPQIALSQDFPCDLDHAAFGLMDPTHAAFVHTSWWWKKKARLLRPKVKHFEPTALGWRMVRHQLPEEHRVYKLLGNPVTTEISYLLPGIRIEHIKGVKHAAVALTAITPISAKETRVHQSLYWTPGWLAPFKPLARYLAGVFLNQDRSVVVRQQEGLAHNPSLMLIDDADTQAKWFHSLKKAWIQSQAEGKPFENPIRPKTLRWNS